MDGLHKIIQLIGGSTDMKPRTYIEHTLFDFFFRLELLLKSSSPMPALRGEEDR